MEAGWELCKGIYLIACCVVFLLCLQWPFFGNLVLWLVFSPVSVCALFCSKARCMYLWWALLVRRRRRHTGWGEVEYPRIFPTGVFSGPQPRAIFLWEYCVARDCAAGC